MRTIAQIIDCRGSAAFSLERLKLRRQPLLAAIGLKPQPGLVGECEIALSRKSSLKVPRPASVACEQVDDEAGELRRRVEQERLDRRIGAQSAIAEEPARNLHWCKFRKIAAARHEMIDRDAIAARGVEHDKLAGLHVGRRHRDPDLAGIEPIEVDERLNAFAQRREIVKAFEAAPWKRSTRPEVTRAPEKARADRRTPVFQMLPALDAGCARMVRMLIGAIPQRAERFNAPIGSRARDQSGVGGADRRARAPQLGVREPIMNGGVGSGLIGAEAHAASEDKRYRWRASLCGRAVHNSSCTDRSTSARPAGSSSVQDRQSW